MTKATSVSTADSILVALLLNYDSGFSTSTQNTLNYLTPSTGEFTTIEQPDTIITIPVSIPPAVDIAMHYDQGTDSMWFTELAKNRVGQYQLD